MTVPLSSDWPRSVLALGVADDERWTPTGNGILIVTKPVVWLVTLESSLPPADAPFSAWVSPANQGTLFDLRDLHKQTGLSWIRQGGFAACLLPVKPEWGTKAFNREQSFLEHAGLPPLAPCATVQFLYGLEEGPFASGPSAPYVIPGAVSAKGPTGFATTLPLHARNLGAPALAVVSTGQEPEVRLIGLIEGATAPGVQQLSAVRPIAGAFALLESEEAQAQQQRVLNPGSAG